MSSDAEGERFLAVFGELKDAVGDRPDELAARWENDERLQMLCDEIYGLIRLFEVQEEWSPYSFTHHVSPAGARARREYDERWRTVVSRIEGRFLFSLLEDLLRGSEEAPEGNEPRDRLGEDIADWKDQAEEDAKAIEQFVDFACSHREVDEFGDLDWVDASVRAWDRLKIAGLDLQGALWRRRAIPHVLVPSHVAKHYGASRASLYRRLHQAGRAFIFGAPLAALALQRAVLEEVLRTHWGSEKGVIRDANLPELSWDSRATRLKRLANEALHSDPETLPADQLERAIIENFLLLRLLIEHAPEPGLERNGAMQ